MLLGIDLGVLLAIDVLWAGFYMGGGGDEEE